MVSQERGSQLKNDMYYQQTNGQMLVPSLSSGAAPFLCIVMCLVLQGNKAEEDPDDHFAFYLIWYPAVVPEKNMCIGRCDHVASGIAVPAYDASKSGKHQPPVHITSLDISLTRTRILIPNPHLRSWSQPFSLDLRICISSKRIQETQP